MRSEINEKIIQLLEEEFDVKIYFYHGISNMNTLKGRYNIFINKDHSIEKKLELIKKYIMIKNNETMKIETKKKMKDKLIQITN